MSGGRNGCPSGWSQYGSRCFIFMHREMPWIDAEKYCVRNGANLASVHTAQEYRFIQDVVKMATGGFRQTWIGGTDAIEDRTWFWSDGSGLHFQLWGIGEPNNLNGNERCLEINRSDSTGLKELQTEKEVGEEILDDVYRSSCPPGWSKYGSRCFIFINRAMPWVNAEKYCTGNGGNLASVHNRGEYQFIQEVVRGGTGRFPQAWIGGNDAVKNYVWLWSDGSGFHFQDWAIAQPDNNQNNEKCVAMNQADELLWGDVRCELSLPFVCGTRPL
ncbi:type-2 ice-structuring protein-like [Anoplopoma fimbria]|uniref:type-2 ice-structuring protein-like n=1 Tax=Anoplopoma fimbria TaxID=229290 RepID=UPI0023EDB7EE|nr:type-2 ice-structuring protein-like [Anoplopoma fimbria]